MNIDTLRDEYKFAQLDEKDAAKDPLKQFEIWFEEALTAELPHPTAMTLSSVGANGFPESRVVLLKYFSEDGFIFFTNYSSDKGKSLEKNAAVGLHFFWPELERQIRITGYAEKTSIKISETYFDKRPQQSQIAAWASEQSKVIPSRKYLQERYKKYQGKFANQKIPRPDFWGGYTVKPLKMEFWQGRENRLHDRILYEKQNGNWMFKRLAP
jgi:pyridoxamine 5'-phosphate oxidase